MQIANRFALAVVLLSASTAVVLIKDINDNYCKEIDEIGNYKYGYV